MLLSNEIGMDVSQVRVNVDKMVDSYNTLLKLEASLKSFNERFDSYYQSNNSVRLSKNNNYIVNSIHSQYLNLKSYKLYTEEYIKKYTTVTENAVTQVEGLQTNDQKTYTFNYHRDNLIQLSKYYGRHLAFMEMNADKTGEKFNGTLVYGRTGVEVNGIEQGEIYITVSGADEQPITDVRDIVKNTAIITTPLEDVVLVGTESKVVTLETSLDATVTATSKAPTIATASYTNGKLTITGVAAGNTIIELVTSATGEATSYRTIAVTVEGE